MVKSGIAAVIILLVAMAAASPAQTGTETKKKAVPAVQRQAAPVYACPMHPEVTAVKAGPCTKCGMALVAKTPASAPAAAPKKVTPKKPCTDQHGGCGTPCGEPSEKPCEKPCGSH